LVAAARRAAVVASVAAATEGARDSHPTMIEVKAHV
jgi:hypothetical protein